MATFSFIFIGQPEDRTRLQVHDKGTKSERREQVLSAKKGDGPDEVTRYGFTFRKNGNPVAIPDTPENQRYIAKLRGNAHFTEVKPESKTNGDNNPRRGPGRPPSGKAA